MRAAPAPTATSRRTARSATSRSAKYTRAKLFQEQGKRTPLFVRFSTVIHGGHSPETLRDPRGFAIKIYTEDGNWDLVGNNLQVFFIRDAMKFPDVVHAFKPDPVTNRQDPNRIFDFVSLSPSAMHMITWLFSPWGIPPGLPPHAGLGRPRLQVGQRRRATPSWSSTTGSPSRARSNLTQEQASEIQATNFNHATQDLYDAIARGDFPKWELQVQIMEDGEHPELDFDPLDPTKIWPRGAVPAAAGRHDGAGPQPGELLRRGRAGRLRDRRAGGRPRLLGRQAAPGPHLLLLGHPALPGRAELLATADQRPEDARSTPTSATAR